MLAVGEVEQQFLLPSYDAHCSANPAGDDVAKTQIPQVLRVTLTQRATSRFHPAITLYRQSGHSMLGMTRSFGSEERSWAFCLKPGNSANASTAVLRPTRSQPVHVSTRLLFEEDGWCERLAYSVFLVASGRPGSYTMPVMQSFIFRHTGVLELPLHLCAVPDERSADFTHLRTEGIVCPVRTAN